MGHCAIRNILITVLCTLACLVLASCAQPLRAEDGMDPDESTAGSALTSAPRFTQVRALSTNAEAKTVAFSPDSGQLAWLNGPLRLRVLDLNDDTLHTHEFDDYAFELAYSPNGSLWVVGNKVERFQHGARVCQGPGKRVELLLEAHDDSMVAAGWSHGDGIGPLIYKAWFDSACQLIRDAYIPLKPSERAHSIMTAEALRSYRRKNLPSWSAARLRGDRLLVPGGPALPLPGEPVAASEDGRWWVFAGAKPPLTLWRIERASAENDR